MQDPLITIAIPTRERAETLASALKTLTSQVTEDCEFLVSDNASADETQEVVSRITDPRVRYVRLPSRGSMSSNFDLALSHARGKYISYLGDDDGFTPGSLEYLSKLCRLHQPDAISWSEGLFRWPGVDGDFPAQKLVFNNDLFRIKTNAIRPLWQLGLLRWGYCPIVYGGLVRIEILNRLRGSDGKFFQSEIPDVYSTAVLMDSLKEYLYVDCSLSIFGFSKKSNAASYISRNVSGADDPLAKFKKEFERPAHPRFSGAALKSDHAPIYECLLRTNDLKNRSGSLWFDAFWHLRIARSLSKRAEPYRSHALAELSQSAPRPYLRALVNLYPREKTNVATVAAVDVPGEESPHPTIYDLCNAAGQFHQRLGIARSLQPTTEVNTILDAISFRKFILSRPAITDLSTNAEEPPATRARVRHREVQSCS
jgi:glycosyltransferase involved in cell wall biosynthesis